MGLCVIPEDMRLFLFVAVGARNMEMVVLRSGLSVPVSHLAMSLFVFAYMSVLSRCVQCIACPHPTRRRSGIIDKVSCFLRQVCACIRQDSRFPDEAQVMMRTMFGPTKKLHYLIQA